jgi:hypothetical protein
VVERSETMDWRRNGMFTAFGLVYLGYFQYYLYNVAFLWMCAPITRTFGTLAAAPVMTFIDQCIQCVCDIHLK